VSSAFRQLCHQFSCIRDLAFSPDSKTLCATVQGHGFWFWDVASRKCTDTFDPTRLHGTTVEQTIFSADGKTAAYLGDGRIALWDVSRRKLLGFLEEGDLFVNGIAFSFDGKTLSSLSTEREELWIWDVEKKRKVRTCKLPTASSTRVVADSGIKMPLVACGLRPGETNGFTLIDAFTGKSVLTCKWGKEDGPLAYHFALNHAETMVASAGGSSPIQLWERKSGQRIALLKFFSYSCTSLVFSPDNKLLAAFYVDDARKPRNSGFLLYDVHSGKIRAHVKQPGIIYAQAFSPDNRLLAVKSEEEIKVWKIPEQWRRDK
jgi:WD40 repeat protein